jgi:hypothetical protein
VGKSEVKVPVSRSAAAYAVFVKGSEETVDLLAEEWLLGPFHPLYENFVSGKCHYPSACFWELGPGRCPFHECFS